MANVEPKPHTVPRFESLEGMRAVLAWWVVIGHLLGAAGLTPRSLPDGFQFIRLGEIAVYVFMIISGFVITHLIMMRKETYLEYIIRRFFRLWPVFMLVITFVILVLMAGIPFKGRYDASIWMNWIVEATMLHGLVPDQLMNNASQRLGGPGWSISLEWQFYLIAPLLIFCFVSKSWWRWLVVAVLVAAAALGALGYVDTVLNLNFDLGTVSYRKPSAIWMSLPFFMIGILCWYLMNTLKLRNISILHGLILAMMAMAFIDDYRTKIALGVWCVVFAIITQEKSFFTKIFTNKHLKWLGEISYSIYITHLPTILILEYILGDRFFGGEGWLFFSMISAVAIPLIILVSATTYYLVERPGIKLGYKISKRFARSRPEFTHG